MAISTVLRKLVQSSTQKFGAKTVQMATFYGEKKSVQDYIKVLHNL